MSVPPLLLRVRVEAPGHRTVRLWLPLVLLWPLLLPVLLLALAAAALADGVLRLAGGRYHQYTLLLVRSLDLLAHSRGTQVRANGNRSIVELAIL